ncbi:MAG: hypothetical protein MMC23_004344 [Stictis urceolatum]|nr:hypothetical protein [Stictis urceolata]
MPLLQHIHLPSPTPYTLANTLQTLLIQNRLNPTSIRLTSPSSRTPQPLVPIVSTILFSLTFHPLLLTFTTPPTYTSGRRQHLTTAQISTLTTGPPPASFEPSLRGGLTTFHGPGQLTAYLILDLREQKLSPRRFVRFLEDSLIRTLAVYGVKGFVRGEYPGVWVSGPAEGGDGTESSKQESGSESDAAGATASEGKASEGEKIASVGVHVRRGITGFGAGLNVSTDPGWWKRFTACGIEGVTMVGLRDLGVRGVEGEEGVERVGETLAEQIAVLPGVEGVQRVSRREVEMLLEEAKRVEGELRVDKT